MCFFFFKRKIIIDFNFWFYFLKFLFMYIYICVCVCVCVCVCMYSSQAKYYSPHYSRYLFCRAWVGCSFCLWFVWSPVASFGSDRSCICFEKSRQHLRSCRLVFFLKGPTASLRFLGKLRDEVENECHHVYFPKFEAESGIITTNHSGIHMGIHGSFI